MTVVPATFEGRKQLETEAWRLVRKIFERHGWKIAPLGLNRALILPEAEPLVVSAPFPPTRTSKGHTALPRLSPFPLGRGRLSGLAAPISRSSSFDRGHGRCGLKSAFRGLGTREFALVGGLPCGLSG
jgi:hypothetical protein